MHGLHVMPSELLTEPAIWNWTGLPVYIASIYNLETNKRRAGKFENCLYHDLAYCLKHSFQKFLNGRETSQCFLFVFFLLERFLTLTVSVFFAFDCWHVLFYSCNKCHSWNKSYSLGREWRDTGAKTGHSAAFCRFGWRGGSTGKTTALSEEFWIPGGFAINLSRSRWLFVIFEKVWEVIFKVGQFLCTMVDYDYFCLWSNCNWCQRGYFCSLSLSLHVGFLRSIFLCNVWMALGPSSCCLKFLGMCFDWKRSHPTIFFS